MQQYKDLIQKVLTEGEPRQNRTGIASRSIFGYQTRFNLQDEFPLVTIRPTSFRIAFEEMMFFLRGKTNTKELEEKNIMIWRGNTSREFLDKNGLSFLEEGDMGLGYSHQIRNFNGHFGVKDGTDQLTNLIRTLMTEPTSRRHIISHWNPSQLHLMALPPCHLLHQYFVSSGGELSCQLYVRSNDIIYGMPYNIAEYAFLTYLLAKVCGYKPKELIYTIGDAHIYDNQKNLAFEMIKRAPMAPPQLVFNKNPTIENFLDLSYADVSIINYRKHPELKNKPPMAV